MRTAEERLILEELVRRGLVQDQSKIPNVLEGLFEQQIALVNDPSRFKAGLCSRRAGKTYMSTRYITQTCLNFPSSVVAYVTKTRQNAKDLVWFPLKEINRKYSLGITFNSTELSATFPNGSRFRLHGANDESDIENLRGHAYKMVVLDECASFGGHIKSLIEDVITPALMDYKGTLLAIGTPGEICAGFFYDITTDPMLGWSVYKWSITDNPMFPQWAGLPNWREVAQQETQKILKEKFMGDDRHPSFQREYLGNWAFSSDKLMYHPDSTKNLISRESIKKYNNVVLGVDLGWHDKTAFVPVGYNQITQECVQLDEIAQSGLTLPSIIGIIESLIDRYNPERILVDAAGAGKIVQESLAEEIRKRYSIPVIAAEKTRKASYVRIADGDIVTGKIKFLKDGVLWQQIRNLQWDEKFQREAEQQECDLHDAWLYAYRDCVHWAKESAPANAPAVGTSEYWKMIEEKMEQADEEQFSKVVDEYNPEDFDPEWYEV